jgi:hypothetical protein
MPSSLRGLAFGGREENQHCEFFRDVVKMMLHFGGDEHHTARGNFVVFLVNFEAGSSADHVIDLIFVMRPLQVRAPAGRT